MISRIIICIFLLSGALSVKAQPALQKNSLPEQIAHLLKSYDSIFNPEKELINGRAYYPSGDTVNHPYFGQNAWKKGIVYHNGIAYSSSLLKYDICSDRLVNIFINSESSSPVFLNRNVVREFVINTHHFRFLEDTLFVGKKFLKTGYYEVLYEGKICLYLRWMKSMENDRITLETVYPETVLFIIKKEGKLKNIRNLRELTEALDDHKNEIKAFISKNHLQFRKKEFASFDKVLEYYDSL